MKLLVDNTIHQALFAAEQSQSIQRLHGAWFQYKLFKGPEELTLLHNACQAVQQEYGGVCRVEIPVQ